MGISVEKHTHFKSAFRSCNILSLYCGDTNYYGQGSASLRRGEKDNLFIVKEGGPKIRIPGNGHIGSKGSKGKPPSFKFS